MGRYQPGGKGGRPLGAGPDGVCREGGGGGLGGISSRLGTRAALGPHTVRKDFLLRLPGRLIQAPELCGGHGVEQDVAGRGAQRGEVEVIPPDLPGGADGRRDGILPASAGVVPGRPPVIEFVENGGEAPKPDDIVRWLVTRGKPDLPMQATEGSVAGEAGRVLTGGKHRP